MTELRNTYKRKIGYLPFRNVLYGNLTLKEMSNFLLSQYKAKPEEFELKIEWFAKFWDLKPFVSRRLSTLTDGQLQTVKFFISMLHSPSVLIIDEPFNGLGSGSTEKIRELFTDIQNRQVTVLATSSSPELITRITERQAIISKGRVE
jgi:ABC-2 type transport system ATP-binding protein